MDLSQASRTARFWWYFGAILTGSVGLFLALVHINPFAKELGLSGTEANLLIGLVGAGNVGGRLFLGGIGDKIGPKRLLDSDTLPPKVCFPMNGVVVRRNNNHKPGFEVRLGKSD
jgi:predicted MFS family arabinose efflux permease